MKIKQTSMVKTIQITPNNWNTNRMDAIQFARLCKQIEKRGFVDPVDVVLDPERLGTDKYVILDGYHRYKAAKQLKYPEIACMVYEKEEFASKIDMEMFGMTKNRLHGEDDQAKLKERVDIWLEQTDFEVWEIADETGLNADSLNFLITEDYSAFFENEEALTKERQKSNLPFLGMYLPTDLADLKITDDIKQLIIDFLRQMSNKRKN